MGLKISLIFDHFAHPNQPFWTALYNKLNTTSDFELKVFYKYLHGGKSRNFFPLKLEKRWLKLLNIHNYFIQGHHSKISLKQYLNSPYLAGDSNQIVHILNAQQYPFLKLYLENTRLIVSFRGFETLVRPIYDTKWKTELQNLYLKADRLHFVSNFIMDAAIKLGAPKEKCIVIRRSVDTEFFKPLDKVRKNEILQFCTIGRLIWQKGYLFGLEALARLKKDGIRFRYSVIGEGPDLEELNFHAQRLGISEDVLFLGAKNREEIREILLTSDFYFHPSVSEALPNTILEASSMALPIIASKAGGIPEAVQDGRNALLSEIADVQGIYNSLKQFISKPEQIEKMGKMSRKFIIDNFNTEKELNEWKKLYMNMMS
ncbi:MAG: glycosyltransferase family 4 protein [Cytophagales bacterium]